MKKYTAEELKKILDNHKLWLETNRKEGRRADLSEVDLEGANLRGVDLERADLEGADLRLANLRGANLREAYLKGADLRGANLRGADLEGADLRLANLSGANLRRADLRGAYLKGADLERIRNAELSLNHQYATIDEQHRHLFNPEKSSLADSRKKDNQKIKELENQLAELEIQKSESLSEKEKGKYEKRIEQVETDKQSIEKKLKAQQDLENEIRELRGELKERKQLSKLVEKISSTKDKNDILFVKYGKQSTGLMRCALVLFLIAISFTVYKFHYIYEHPEITPDLWTFAPGFILSLIAIALLRHDWKLRELSQQLITQNNKIDIAVGILEGSLELSYIEDIPDELNDSFKEVRKALLNSTSENESKSDGKNNEDVISLLKNLSKVVK